jgi:hypothetical protein
MVTADVSVTEPRVCKAAPEPAARPRQERRVPGERERVHRCVADEFREMPGLKLTLAQARRLFALREDICARVLVALIEEGLLMRSCDDLFVRRSFEGRGQRYH